MKTARSGQLVLVRWHDAAADAGWTAVSDLMNKPSHVTSIGWVVAHDAKALTIAGDRGRRHRRRMKTGGQVNRPLVIPCGMIQKVWEIHL